MGGCYGYCGACHHNPAREAVLSKHIIHRFLGFPLAALLLALGACVTPEPPEQARIPAEQLYDEALALANNSQSTLAATRFEEVERQHPYSDLAARAQIMAAWSYYDSNNYDDAVVALDRFIELTPADELVEYAYYLKALSFYEQIVDIGRDAKMTRLALGAFDDLLTRFPNGDYSRDAKLKSDLARSNLAGKEMAVGRFYVKRGYYTAAIRRFENVVRDYQTTNQVPEALYRIGTAYLALGLEYETRRVAEVAKFNYPDSFWTDELVGLVEGRKEPGVGGFLRRAFGG